MKASGNLTATRIAVLVSGNGSNLQALIDARTSGQLTADLVLVLSNRADAFALQRAHQAGIEAIALPHRGFSTREAFDAEVVKHLRARNVDWVVFAGFMRLVTTTLLDAFPHRILNLHPSLLPAFPGTEAIKQALSYGVRVTGCTVHLVTPDMDAGPIVDQQIVRVHADDTLSTLSDRVHAAEHELLVKCVDAAVNGRLHVITVGKREHVIVEPA